jgi:hypothetical protein
MVCLHETAILRFMHPVRKIALSLLALATLPELHGQGLLGTVLGTVTDASGALINGAAVKAKNLANNLEVSTHQGQRAVLSLELAHRRLHRHRLQGRIPD